MVPSSTTMSCAVAMTTRATPRRRSGPPTDTPGEPLRPVVDRSEVIVASSPSAVVAGAMGRPATAGRRFTVIDVNDGGALRRPYRPGADAATADAESGRTPSCANKELIPTWQLNSAIRPLRTSQKSAVGISSVAPVGWITPAGVSNCPAKVPRIDSSIATTFSEDVDPVPGGFRDRREARWSVEQP